MFDTQLPPHQAILSVSTFFPHTHTYTCTNNVHFSACPGNKSEVAFQTAGRISILAAPFRTKLSALIKVYETWLCPASCNVQKPVANIRFKYLGAGLQEIFGGCVIGQPRVRHARKTPHTPPQVLVRRRLLQWVTYHTIWVSPVKCWKFENLWSLGHR